MQPIIERIQKLLALAGNNSNEHEAALAAEKAAAMMAEHNISILSLNRQTNTNAARKDKQRKGGLYSWQRDIWKAVAELNFCMYFSIKGTTKGSSYEQRLIGSEVNVISAEVLGEYLQQTIDRMGHTWAKDNGYKSGFVREAIAYREGLAVGLVARITRIMRDREAKAHEESKANTASGSTALTILDVLGSEHDLNQDYIKGYEPGTHARIRREYEERARAREEANRKWREENPEQAAAFDEQRERENREWMEEYMKKQAKRAKKEPKPRYRALTDREKRASLSAHTEGYFDSDKISLNKQVDSEEKARIE